ncbi:endonuclease domain-containing protein [Methylobacterium radiodurans]|uniref:DUF559 domain-containing protein n=1 Tax=Methylobacterium radiodurans TaxID=2202828 RepID=A0A2U8VXJ8_9HYPH|nr:DUF559 domain-containing protein [Methylobacterium radiodurans]AWN37856.1 hypothetical protein DK427_20720 [Methylobacterium radiodurans]
MRAGRPEPTAFRRGLRVARTEAERRLWYRLRDRRLGGFEVVRQETIGSYVAGLCCREARLIIEVDGSPHAESTHDQARDERLTARGYRILRFWNAEVLNNTLGVLDTILAALPPSPRVRGEGCDDLVVGAASPKGEGEGAASEETRPEPPPHPRLPPRCDDDRVVASLSPWAGRGEIPA